MKWAEDFNKSNNCGWSKWLKRMKSTKTLNRPNVLLIMADQLRWDALSSYGQRAISTPNIDKLAKSGVQFTKAYTSVPVCKPARAGLVSGMKPWNHGMLAMGDMAD